MYLILFGAKSPNIFAENVRACEKSCCFHCEHTEKFCSHCESGLKQKTLIFTLFRSMTSWTE